MRGYKMYTCHRNKRVGGVAINVGETIEHLFVNFKKLNGIEIVGISVLSRDVKLYVLQICISAKIGLSRNMLINFFR